MRIHLPFQPALTGLGFLLLLSLSTRGQDSYRYTVDLTQATDDRLTVDLLCPAITGSTIHFYLPRIVPGTYMNSNYGKYVQGLKAYDKTGKELSVSKTDDNSWQINDASSLHRISYQVEDTWDASIDNLVYTMCGTNFEAGKNFVINTCGLFGYFEGMKKTPFNISFTKPTGFYAATGLVPLSSDADKDVFRCATADELYDSPIMFSLPDTTTVKVGSTDVLVAVYSPRKMASSKFIAANLEKLLLGARDYLKGKLPVKKYAFIFYLNGEQKKLETSGAWEHSYSSFYSLDEEPEQQAIANWIDFAAHEFFHIVTPLTISSKEVKDFNFNETVLSKHLWLYEGSTEYDSHHMQVWAGLTTPATFLEKLSTAISYSRRYFNDSLPFAQLSKESAGKWHEQYMNVYLKGCAISACIDLYLLKLSGGQYSLRDLKHDLGVKFGADKYFEDEELYDEIEKLSYPEIKQFLLTYVEGSTPIPYEEFFALAGVDYQKQKTIQAISLGNIDIDEDSKGKLRISTSRMNQFGKHMGYMDKDELISINGIPVNSGNLTEQLTQFSQTVKEGDMITVKVRRKQKGKKEELVTMSGKAFPADKIIYHTLDFNPQANSEQLKLRKIWLNNH